MTWRLWIAEATQSGIEALARFARGLQDDLAAVTAGAHTWRGATALWKAP